MREPADIAIVSDPAEPGNDTAFAMKLRGGTICVPEVVLGTRTGPVIVYDPATAVKREVWVSDRFRTANAAFCELLTGIVAETTSSWVLLDSSDAFEYAKAEAQLKRKNAQVVGLVTQKEATHLKKDPSQYQFQFDAT